VQAALERGPDQATRILGSLVQGFTPEQLKQCLEFCREWNTNARHCHAAQAALQALLLHHPPHVGVLHPRRKSRVQAVQEPAPILCCHSSLLGGGRCLCLVIHPAL
jgi:hypothetical protein